MWWAKLSVWLGVLSACAALVAAAYWFRSAAGKPATLGTYWGRVPETDAWMIEFRRSARNNQIAAIASGVSAALGAGASLMSAFGI